jgi:hypothetical protein
VLDRGYANFLELRKGEVRGIPLLRTWVNKGKKEERAEAATAAFVKVEPKTAPGGLAEGIVGISAR